MQPPVAVMTALLDLIIVKSEDQLKTKNSLSKATILTSSHVHHINSSMSNLGMGKLQIKATQVTKIKTLNRTKKPVRGIIRDNSKMLSSNKTFFKMKLTTRTLHNLMSNFQPLASVVAL